MGFNDCAWLEDDAVILATSACRDLTSIAVSPLLSLLGPWGLGNLSLVDYFHTGSQAFEVNSQTVFHHEIVIGLKTFQNVRRVGTVVIETG